MSTQHADAGKFRKVAKTIKDYAAQEITWLDMNTGSVYDCSDAVDAESAHDGQDCGTMACIAGHYLLAKLGRENAIVGCHDNGILHYKEMPETELHFADGALMMAEDLGFRDRQDLEIFLDKHPELWGNDEGGALFDIRQAWPEPYELADIADHLSDVADRIEKAQKED